MPFAIQSLPQGFGAEVRGFDAQAAHSSQDIAALQSAFATHNLLILRDCGQLSPERQAEIAGWFGRTGADGAIATTMDNAVESGRARLKFHCDITYFPHPLEGISLHSVLLPDGETSTTFVSNAVAWDTLPAALQDDLRERKARHYYEDEGMMGVELSVFEQWHPVCMPHYRTGRPLLFVTEYHTVEIEGHDEAEGRQLLKRLFAHLYAPERQYEHIWRKGDLVIWDNYAVQHARTREADPAQGRRLLQRVSFGEHGFAEQFEQLVIAAKAARSGPRERAIP